MVEVIAYASAHFQAVAKIYEEGISTGIATFEIEVPNQETWERKFLVEGRLIALYNNQVAGWGALSQVSSRAVYRGVAENTVYIGTQFRNKGIGKILLQALIEESERLGYWTLLARVFPQNLSSIQLHKNCGFRVVGRKEKIAQRSGIWHDNIELERRSKKIYYMKNVLVLCTGNSCRSQMAHGYLKEFGQGKIQVFSAGIETHGLNPGAVSIMAEDGIDISKHTSNHVDEYLGIEWDYIITVCDHAHENCPFIPAPNAQRLHHNFFDPSKVSGTEAQKHAAFEQARNEIKEYCRKFIETQW